MYATFQLQIILFSLQKVEVSGLSFEPEILENPNGFAPARELSNMPHNWSPLLETHLLAKFARVQRDWSCVDKPKVATIKRDLYKVKIAHLCRRSGVLDKYQLVFELMEVVCSLVVVSTAIDVGDSSPRLHHFCTQSPMTASSLIFSSSLAPRAPGLLLVEWLH